MFQIQGERRTAWVKLTDEIIRDDKIEPGISPWNNPSFPVPKKKPNDYRLVEDFRRVNDEWAHFSFRGTKWQSMNAADRQLYLKNTYRVLLTRARQGMVIFIPPGDSSDPTRPPQVYDSIYEYLQLCGIPSGRET
jgi:hypothetical protein